MISPVIAFTVKRCKVFPFLSSSFSSLYSLFFFFCLLILGYLGGIFREIGESRMLTNFSRNAFFFFYAKLCQRCIHYLILVIILLNSRVSAM